MLNALSQAILKIAAPGVPDFYQGSELWALNLVDPDNRRPVDYARRCAMLKKIREGACRDPLATTRHLLKDMSSGAIKMYLINRAMEFRRENPDLFMRGDYLPLKVVGPRANHIVAFARVHEGKRAVVVCGRFFMQLAEAPPLPVDPKAWTDTFIEMEPGSSSKMTDLITGRVDFQCRRAARGRGCIRADAGGDAPRLAAAKNLDDKFPTNQRKCFPEASKLCLRPSKLKSCGSWNLARVRCRRVGCSFASGRR